MDARRERWTAASAPAVSAATPVDVSVLEEFIGKDQQVIGEFLQQFCVDAKRLALDIVRACATGRPSDAAAALINSSRPPAR